MSVVRFYILFTAVFAQFLSVQTTFAQEKNEVKSWFVEAESYFLFEEYKEALPLYQRIIRSEKENYNVHYKIGVCYLNDIYKTGKAIQYLETAARYINPDYKYNSYKEKMAPPEALYYLGSAYHITNQFDKALEKYHQFYTTADPKEFDLDLVQADIEACQRAKSAFEVPTYFRPQNMGGRINSRFEDINPVMSGDGKVLAFTRRMPFYDGVFISYKNEDGAWSPPRNLTENFKADGDNYTTGISHFGDELFIYRSDNYDGNIYHSKRLGNRWTPLEKLNSNINSKYWESHASPTPDGQYLFFTSNREGGYGGLDIYKSRKTTQGEWGAAVNLGPVVNTPENEETPFVSNEGYTLYFSSQGHNTIGGYDLYISSLSSAGVWEKPYNMGYPINTTSDDLFFCPSGIDAFGYYSYYSADKGKGMLDIYHVEIYNQKIPRPFTIEGKVALESIGSSTINQVMVKLLAAANRKKIAESGIDNQGIYKLKTIQGSYVLRVEVPGMDAIEQQLILKVGQEKSNIVLPDIVFASDFEEIPDKIQEPVEPEVVSPVATIETRNTYYEVSDSSAIPIELKLAKGSDLNISITLDDKLVEEEELSDVKKRFMYFYKPKPGVNTLRFEAIDADGQLATTEILIDYTPVVEEEEEVYQEPESLSMEGEAFKHLAGDDLAAYLSVADMEQFENLAAVYMHLKEAAASHDFTNQMVQDMFVQLYSQKGLGNFRNAFESILPIDDSLSEACSQEVVTPIQYVKNLVEANQMTSADIDKTLLTLLTDGSTSLESVYTTLLSHAGADMKELAISDITRSEDILAIFEAKYPKEATELLRIAATSEPLNFFYQNLMMRAGENLRSYLAALQLSQEGIYTAPALVEHLFNQVSDSTYSLEELLEALEKARQNKTANVDLFHQLLTTTSEGTLKSQLMLLEGSDIDLDTYESFLNYLLGQSKFKNYSRESVYQMLLNLIDITHTEDFAEKLMSFGYSDLNNAIADTSLKYFSNPFELVQYLVAASQSYDFTTSDINNLLIRMILEQGLDTIEDLAFDTEKPKRFWRSREFVTSVVLVNLILIILIILFTLRRKRE